MTIYKNPAPFTNTILIALGGNISFQRLDGSALFEKALFEMSMLGLDPVRASNVWKSPAWPDPRQKLFSNAIVKLSANTSIAQAKNGAYTLLSRLQTIESRFGRSAQRTSFDRCLDLDLIDFRGQIIQPKRPQDLALPHPQAHKRSFVMAPLYEVAPDWRHPLYDLTAEEMRRKSMQKWPCWIADPIRLPNTGH